MVNVSQIWLIDHVEPTPSCLLSLACIHLLILMVQEIATRVRHRESFAFETTLSGIRYARLIPQWRKKGFSVKLVFLKLPNPEMGIARVAARIAQGGHGVPEEVIRRRFVAGWRNFQEIYKPLVNAWILYDNALDWPIFVDSGGKEE